MALVEVCEFEFQPRLYTHILWAPGFSQMSFSCFCDSKYSTFQKYCIYLYI